MPQAVDRLKLEMIGQFHPKREPVLRDDVLEMEAGGGLVVFVVQQIVEAGGGIEVFDEVMAVEDEIEDDKIRRVRPGLRIAENVRENRVAGTGVLAF